MMTIDNLRNRVFISKPCLIRIVIKIPCSIFYDCGLYCAIYKPTQIKKRFMPPRKMGFLDDNDGCNIEKD